MMFPTRPQSGAGAYRRSAIVAAHAALIAIGMNWYTPAAGARRFLAGDHGRHGAGFGRAASDAAGARAGTSDAAGRRLAARARGSGSRAGRQIAPTPPQEKPEVVAPPEQKVEMKPATEPAKPVPDAKPTPVKPKVVRPDAKKPTDAPPAPRTDGAAAAERQAPAASAVSAGATASAIASYSQRVRAHLMRFHQYPPAANPRASRASRGSASRSAAAVRCFRSASAAHQAIRALDAQTLAMRSPRPAVSGISAGNDAGLDSLQHAGDVQRPQLAGIAYSFTAPVSDDT